MQKVMHISNMDIKGLEEFIKGKMSDSYLKEAIDLEIWVDAYGIVHNSGCNKIDEIKYDLDNNRLLLKLSFENFSEYELTFNKEDSIVLLMNDEKDNYSIICNKGNGVRCGINFSEEFC